MNHTSLVCDDGIGPLKVIMCGVISWACPSHTYTLAHTHVHAHAYLLHPPIEHPDALLSRTRQALS